jgi:trehalose-6-phosphatase
MQLVEDTMNHYVDKLDGAYIDKKETSIIFNFSETDSQFGYMITIELTKRIQKVQG